MKVTFNINFHTVWGQNIYVTGSIPELGEWDVQKACPMKFSEDGNWKLTIELPDKTTEFEYRYFLRSNDKLIFEEWQKNHRIKIQENNLSYYLYDFWQNKPQNLFYYSSAFTKSFFAHPDAEKTPDVNDGKKIILKVWAPQIKKDQYLALSGQQTTLGNWDINKSIPLIHKKDSLWTVTLDLNQLELTFPLEFKFLVFNKTTQAFVSWESGENRVLNLHDLKENEVAVVSGLQFREEAPSWKCAGLVIPVFSLRSQDSCGIGDFGDLKKIVDWVKLTHQKIIQILPINDTTKAHSWMDSYPYNAISIYALHPIYLNLREMGELKDPERNEYFKKKSEELNHLSTVEYEKVDQVKWSFFREIFEQEGENTIRSDKFQQFFVENEDWLIPYAAYSYLRDINHTPDFNHWKQFSKYDRQAILSLCDPSATHYREIELYYYLQFHLHKQLTEARDYAYINEVILKGDIPIGISKTSIEAWTEPNYFNMHMQAGAPPDDFSASGQNWGFPTYNWQRIEEDNYDWWKKRFRKMSDYFDAYRIDHILGFFRIWEIPESSVEGLCAWFDPSLPFSATELESAGLNFEKQRFTTPHINESFLPEIFGEYTSEVKAVYLERSSSHHFALKKQFDTQFKIKEHFKDKTDPTNQTIKKGLWAIANEVLFIQDPEKKGMYHPRIAASSTYIYHELSNTDRYAFDYLYWNYFYQRHNEFWKEQGYKHLAPLIASTDMLVCGEDLGMIPQSVPEVMHKLQILTLEIERMPKEMNMDFSNLHHLPYLSVCTTSTHDMSTIRGWWQEDKEKTQRYFNHILQQPGTAPMECSGNLCEKIVLNHLSSPSMLVIIPLQDWLSMDELIRRENYEEERINVPANPSHYWKYRMHLNIEELINTRNINDKIKELIEKTNR